MGKYQPLIWAIIGGVTLAVVNVAFSWYVGGAEWTDSALFPIPFLLIIGGAIGAASRHPPPPPSPPPGTATTSAG